MGIAREPEPLFYAIILECAVLVCPRVSHTRKKIPPSATEAEFFSLLDERAGVRNKDLFRQPRMRRTVHPFFRSRTVFNSLLWIGFAVLDLSVTLAVFRYFGKVGLYALIVFDLLICNIQVLKIISLFGLTTTLGNILYAGVFLATDILSECYGKKAATRGVLLGFTTLVMGALYMQIALLFTPGPGDFIQPHLEAVFGIFPRVIIGSLAAYFISQHHDVWAFHFWRKRTKGKMLWLRNNASTLVSQLLDTLVFCSIAFLGVFPLRDVIEICISTYAIKALVALLDTPFIYGARSIFEKHLRHRPGECEEAEAAK